MKIIVLSKMSFDRVMQRDGITDENVENAKNNWFISINDSTGTTEVPHFSQDHHNVIRLFFDDVEEDIVVSKEGEKPFLKARAFTQEQAQAVLQLLSKIKETEKTQIVLHCAAGISRSGAVGAFCADYFRIPHSDFVEWNPHTLPNPQVSRLLNQEYRKQLFKKE